MAKMWAGRTDGQTDSTADDFNSSLSFDKRLYRQDIKGSIVHAAMLARKHIISQEDADKITEGLEEILNDLENGRLDFDPECEDIHMFVEQILTQRIGSAGKKLHTARSRNDQVALDMRMYVRDEIDDLTAKLEKLIRTVTDLAADNIDAVMPGYTHLQRAQPVLFSHEILAYAWMFVRDTERLSDCRRRTNVSPIGACALAGTTYDTDRAFEASALGFDYVSPNSIDSVSDRDFCVEFLGCMSVIMMHLSRFSEEIILWSSWEFKFIELSDSFTTGSSIMPQKKNPDMAELVRGKTGRVYGNLISLLTTLKGLPLAYNKDMQEDKEAVFDSVDTLKQCLDVFTPMIATAKVLSDNMFRAAGKGFINATDLADYLVRKGLPFRTAYKISGGIVAHCLENDRILETLTLDEYRKFSELFDSDLYREIDLKNCVKKRISEGGTSPDSVISQISRLRERFGTTDGGTL